MRERAKVAAGLPVKLPFVRQAPQLMPLLLMIVACLLVLLQNKLLVLRIAIPVTEMQVSAALRFDLFFVRPAHVFLFSSLLSR